MQGAGSKVKAHKTSGGRKMPVRHTIPLGIVIFLVISSSSIQYMDLSLLVSQRQHCTNGLYIQYDVDTNVNVFCSIIHCRNHRSLYIGPVSIHECYKHLPSALEICSLVFDTVVNIMLPLKSMSVTLGTELTQLY